MPDPLSPVANTFRCELSNPFRLFEAAGRVACCSEAEASQSGLLQYATCQVSLASPLLPVACDRIALTMFGFRDASPSLRVDLVVGARLSRADC